MAKGNQYVSVSMQMLLWNVVVGSTFFNSEKCKKCGTLHDFACHPCAGAMLIFSVSFQF